MAGWPLVELGEVVEPILRGEVPDTEKEYRLIGVKWWGAGAYEYARRGGGETKAPLLYEVRTDDVIINKIWARHGSVSVVTSDLDGAHGSSEFPTFVVDRDRLDPQWIKWWSKSPVAWSACAALSYGTSGMNRIQPRQFLSLAIQLPPLAEQLRIVARLNAVAEKIAIIRASHAQTATELNELIVASHFSASSDRRVRFAELIDLHEDKAPVEQGIDYPQVGIRGFARGMFTKDSVSSINTTYRHFNRLYQDAFVVSQVKGWEGAVAVCASDFAGLFVSPEYRTFRCRPSYMIPGYLAAIVSTDWFLDGLATLTRGQGARRERLRPEMLLDWEVPMPSVAAQADLLAQFRRVSAVQRGHARIITDCEALLPAMLNDVFG